MTMLAAVTMCERLEAWLRDQMDVYRVDADKTTASIIITLEDRSELVIDVYDPDE